MRGERGFTLVELIVAVMVYTIGVLGILASAALITGLLGAGDRAATANFYALERLEILRATPCAALASGQETRADVYVLDWVVQTGATGSARTIQIAVAYPVRPGVTRTDSLGTVVACT